MRNIFHERTRSIAHKTLARNNLMQLMHILVVDCTWCSKVCSIRSTIEPLHIGANDTTACFHIWELRSYCHIALLELSLEMLMVVIMGTLTAPIISCMTSFLWNSIHVNKKCLLRSPRASQQFYHHGSCDPRYFLRIQSNGLCKPSMNNRCSRHSMPIWIFL